MPLESVPVARKPRNWPTSCVAGLGVTATDDSVMFPGACVLEVPPWLPVPPAVVPWAQAVAHSARMVSAMIPLPPLIPHEHGLPRTEAIAALVWVSALVISLFGIAIRMTINTFRKR